MCFDFAHYNNFKIVSVGEQWAVNAQRAINLFIAFSFYIFDETVFFLVLFWNRDEQMKCAKDGNRSESGETTIAKQILCMVYMNSKRFDGQNWVSNKPNQSQ